MSFGRSTERGSRFKAYSIIPREGGSLLVGPGSTPDQIRVIRPIQLRREADIPAQQGGQTLPAAAEIVREN